MTRTSLGLALALLLGACGGGNDAAPESTDAAPVTVANDAVESAATLDLYAILDAMPDDFKARYAYRNPQSTLEFFGIEPGMTVVEGLPGGGWYTRILLPYLGKDGHLIAANYNVEMFSLFGFANEERIAAQEAWADGWAEFAGALVEGDAASTEGFYFGAMPEELNGSADAVVFIRVLHNVTRFQKAGEGNYLDQAMQNAFDVLKPGGVFGVVQHEARADTPDAAADGSRGYLKKDFVIATAEAAGFELVDQSPMNENPNDQPSDEDIVWRLPPSLVTSREDPELMAEMQAIGESNRMTLKFVKPAN